MATLVFWDIDDCPIPDGLDACTVSRNIKTSPWKQGYQGSVEIIAFGDNFAINRDDFFYAGIPIFYCPKEKPYVRQTYHLAAFLFKAIGNSYKLIFLLIIWDISQHFGFNTALCYLKSKRYNILLAQPVLSDIKLLSTVCLVWLWSSMSRGEDPLIYSVLNDDDGYNDCEGRYVAAKIPVFWDMDGCKIPQGGNAELISRNIKSAIVNEGFRDTVDQINGFESFGVMPRYFPAGGDRKDKLEKILVDALFYFVDSLDIKNLMLLLGDMTGHDEFIFTSHCLSCRNYHLLITQPDGLEEHLHTESKEKWIWSSLLAGRVPLPLTPSMQALMNYLVVHKENNNKRHISSSLQETSEHGMNTITKFANTQVQQSSSTFTDEINETISLVGKTKLSTSGTAQHVLIQNHFAALQVDDN